MLCFVGCSGFYYKHWKGNFYPENLPQKKWFDYYCQHFNTLELNTTFYHFPKLEYLKNWHSKSPDDFRFSVKAPRSITHFKKFKDSKNMIEDFYDIILEGLKEKLGCFLFQLPPNFSYTEEYLDRLLTSLNPDLTNVLEFRHSSWWNEEVFKKLGKANIAFCGMSHPDFPGDVVHNAANFYFRMHGSKKLYASNYTNKELSAFAKQVLKLKKADQAYIYFNNDAEGFAVKNAKMLSDYLTKASSQR